jgi:hypothetical protein
MSDPVFEFCASNCRQEGQSCSRQEDIDVFTASELISREMDMPSLMQDVKLGAELTEQCRRLYEIREMYKELDSAFLLAPFVERPTVSENATS